MSTTTDALGRVGTSTNGRHPWLARLRVWPESAVESGFEEFERRGLQTTFEMILRVRLVLLVVVTVFAAWVGWVDPAPWRRVLLAVLVLTLATLDIHTRRNLSRRGIEQGGVRLNLAGMVGIQAGLVFASGGLASPLLPVMLPPAFAVGLLLGRWGVQSLVLTIQVPAILIFFALEISGALPTLIPIPFASQGGPAFAKVALIGFVMLVMVLVFASLGAHVRSVAQRHLGAAAQAQADALASHRQRVDELTTLSGEIAHELKNPLASVKGLSQLLARSVPTSNEKNTERLEVLQREVDRMQAILDEFLNYSRPLTPLNRSEVELGPLCRHAVGLHEAMAAERGVHVGVDVSEDLRLQGDARKIGQVLINLLQNALEVAPAGTTIELIGKAVDAGVQIEVRDHGPGVDEEAIASVFEPGMTTKATGHGLGLTVARAIVEQHEGELRLENAPDGGCRSILSLPLQPSEDVA